MVTHANQRPILLPGLTNCYFVMRHGESLANRAGLIVSHPRNGLDGYGLSDTGRQQVKSALRGTSLDAATHIICSDFRRARETAELAHRLLACAIPVESNINLRERDFGSLELGPDHRYAEVWAADQGDTGQQLDGVESVDSVLRRAMDVILNFESRFNKQNCLLIAHGDILQILQTSFFKIPANRHRDLPHLKPAELRRLKIAAD